jgi:hypothetical protein
MKKAYYFLQLVLLAGVFASCKQNPETFAIHNPISPSNTEPVTFTLNKIEGDVETVKLFETIATINSSGAVISTAAETQLQSWSSPITFPLNFTRGSAYASNRLITYRFEVSGNSKTYNQRITFATRPYPVANAAVPVYIVGDVDRALNIVFIPDTSMNSRMPLFRSSVASQIDETFHREDWIRRFRSSYNFFINPQTAIARDFDTGLGHVLPSNSSQLTFAQGRVILHFQNIRDQSGGGYFSSELDVRGTMLHESGHALYRLADEYDHSSASHWQEATFPNNWSSLAGAQAAAPGYNKTAASAVQMGTSGFYRLCVNTCPMRSSGVPINNYDEPCKTRILDVLIHR